MKVVVTDGDNRATLAIVRSLGRAGHEVIVGEKRAPSLAHVSRYCARRFVYSDPFLEPERFIDDVAREARMRAADVLIPVADVTTLLITGHRERFECAIPFAPYETVRRAADKVDTIQTAQRLGVPVPRSVVIHDPDQFDRTDLDFPLVVKPARSRVRTAARWVSTEVSFARDREELLRNLASRSRQEFPVMLQEKIVGPGMGVFACYHEGRPVALFSHRRVRERPPWGGVSVLSESTEMCPQARDFATRLLDDLAWHGVAMVEFKRDVRDNVPKLMEINGRFWGSLQLAIDAGVDFPGLLVRGVSPGWFEPQLPYRVGVRSRWLWGDVDALLLTLFRRAKRPPAEMSRSRAVTAFMKLWGRNLYYENPKWYDVNPWLLETYRRLQWGAQRARRSIAGAAVASEAALKRG